MKALLTAVSVGALLISAPVWAQNTPAQNVPAQTAPAQNTPAHSQNMLAQSQNMPAANQNKTARNTAEPQSWNSQDKSFVDTAASGNLAEAELGRLAWTKSNQPAIKEFGRWMDADHTFANKRLEAIVKDDHASVHPQLTSQQQQMKQQLQALNGAQFDQQYLQHMVQDHEKTIQEFQNEAKQGQDPDLKTYAENLTPLLQQHLDAAKELSASTARVASETPARTQQRANTPSQR